MERKIYQIINSAESLAQDPNGKKILEGAIKNAQRLQDEGEGVRKTLHLLKQVEKATKLIPPKGKERNN
jgi:hypothetical protein